MYLKGLRNKGTNSTLAIISASFKLTSKPLAFKKTFDFGMINGKVHFVTKIKELFPIQ